MFFLFQPDSEKRKSLEYKCGVMPTCLPLAWQDLCYRRRLTENEARHSLGFSKKVNEVYFLSLWDFIFLSDYFSRIFPLKHSVTLALPHCQSLFHSQTPTSSNPTSSSNTSISPETALSIWFWCFLADIMTFSLYNLLLHDVSGDSTESPSTTCWLRSTSTAFIWTLRESWAI